MVKIIYDQLKKIQCFRGLASDIFFLKKAGHPCSSPEWFLTEADDRRNAGKLGIADTLRDGEAGNGDPGEDIVPE